MSAWAAVRLRQAGPLFYARSEEDAIDLRRRDRVFVRSERYEQLAEVVDGEVDLRELPEQPLTLVRKATAADLARDATMRERAYGALKRAKRRVREHGLRMKLSAAEFSLDGSQLLLYFTAEQRVDFRALVRELAKEFKCRIELRQVSPRFEAKLTGGIGPCGQTLCCASWLVEFEPVSVRAAKSQCMSMNQEQLTGQCGRLKCCLKYELHVYKELRKGLPRRGQFVRFGDMQWGKVEAVDVLRQRLEIVDAGGRREQIDKADVVEVSRQAPSAFTAEAE